MKQVANFPASYQLRFDAELPGAGGSFEIFARRTRAPRGCDGPLVLIQPGNANSWLACFCKGYPSGGVIDAVYTTPNTDAVCVISEGVGYWVDTIKREALNIPVFPIRQVECTDRLLLFADFTRLAAFGSNGLVWISHPRVWDHLIIKKVDTDEGRVICQGWNAPSGRAVEVVVNLETGDEPPSTHRASLWPRLKMRKK
ncbi:MAG: hypothetical protein ACYDDI_04830 [Candidatus Acidiferrales bacterium]